ncbi:unnamed protein product, partial [Didymodactylos carnosus]
TDDEHKLHKQRLLVRRNSIQQKRNSLTQVGTSTDGEKKDENVQEHNPDAGIWLLPLLCHVLQTDNLTDAQNWLVNANNTEKRLAMEVISRTMQDMNQEDTASDISKTSAPQISYTSDSF